MVENRAEDRGRTGWSVSRTRIVVAEYLLIFSSVSISDAAGNCRHHDLRDPRRQRAAHPPAVTPDSCADARRLRAEGRRAQAARVDADASMSRGTAMRAARRAAEAEADDEAAEEQEEDVDELLLGCI